MSVGDQRKYACEFIGTSALVFFAAGTAVYRFTYVGGDRLLPGGGRLRGLDHGCGDSAVIRKQFAMGQR